MLAWLYAIVIYYELCPVILNDEEYRHRSQATELLYRWYGVYDVVDDWQSNMLTPPFRLQVDNHLNRFYMQGGVIAGKLVKSK